jgi:DNA polymerase-4
MARVIMHIDMDAFFASVEQKCNPRLRGRPIAVIGSAARTVVTTCSYEARALGVKTGMNKYEARRRCPSLIFVIADNRKYTDTSTRIFSIFKRFTPIVEVYSVDEAFLGFTPAEFLSKSPEETAMAIKKSIMDEIGITCSVGIAMNKLMAKLASAMEKPDGLTVIGEDDIEKVMRELPVSALCGIGKKLSARLALMNIRTCSELAASSRGLLRRHFGIIGERLSLMGQGLDPSPVVPTGEERTGVKSVGHSTTLPRDIIERALIERYILKLSEMVAARARRHALKGAKVTLTLRYSDFTTFTRQATLPEFTDDARVISFAARSILDSMKFTMALRLIGVSLGKVIKDDGQVELFLAERKRGELLHAMDAVNDRFGSFTLTWGALVDEREPSGVISPAWRPLGVKRVDVK